jgi:DNA uptake protein ComE-like DNA-binding protein
MKRNEQGFVLVCVLWVLAILTVLTIGFGRRAMMDRAAATYTLDHAEAMQMARGAVARGIITLQNKAVYDTCNKTSGRTGYSQEWAKPMDLLKENDLFTEGGKKEEKTEEQKDLCMYSIRDESGLICINAASDELLEELDGISRTVMRKINARRRGDAKDKENQYAQPFQTIEELRDMPGISDKEWYGPDRKAGLRSLITCWGDQLVNINTATPEVMKCIPGLSDKLKSGIIDYRAGSDGMLFSADDQDFASLEDVIEKLGGDQDAMEGLRTFCKVDSQFFTITGVATRRLGRISATCIATVKVAGASADIIKWREELVEP